MPLSLEDLFGPRKKVPLQNTSDNWAASELKQQDRDIRNLKPQDSLSAVDPQLGAGIGSGLTEVAQGVGQRMGLVTPEQVAQKRATDAALMSTGMGKIGNLIGSAAPFMGA